MRVVDLYHFNDFHRHLQPFEDGSGGAARMATLANRVKAENPDSVLVNLGDVAGDNAVPGPNAFDPMADVLDAMGVDLLALGNHEFEDPDGNYASLRTGLIEPFDGEVLCANAVERKTGAPLEGTKPYTIRQLAGINVAFIGVVTRDLGLAHFPAAGAGLYLTPIEETLQELVPQVRAEGADAVVVLAHEGLRPMRQVASRVPGIDLILAAHDHQETREPIQVTAPDGATTAVAEAGGYGTYLGHIRLTVDPARRRVVGVEGSLIPVSSNLPADPEVQQLVDAYSGPERLQGPPPRRQWQSINSFEELAARLQEENTQPIPAAGN